MSKRIKKRYQKPVIKQVNLVPEEAVLTVCKTGTAAEDKGGGKVCAHQSGKCKTNTGS
jgi:hypothetical protein